MTEIRGPVPNVFGAPTGDASSKYPGLETVVRSSPAHFTQSNRFRAGATKIERLGQRRIGPKGLAVPSASCHGSKPSLVMYGNDAITVAKFSPIFLKAFGSCLLDPASRSTPWRRRRLEIEEIGSRIDMAPNLWRQYLDDATSPPRPVRLKTLF